MGWVDDSPAVRAYRMLRNAHHHARSRVRSSLAEHGVNWAQFSALNHIPDQGMPLTQLAEHLHCGASNVTGLVDRMAENGWVYRERSVEDRRVWLARLTPEGEALRSSLIPVYLRSIEEEMNRLSPDELGTLISLLQKLTVDDR